MHTTFYHFRLKKPSKSAERCWKMLECARKCQHELQEKQTALQFDLKSKGV
jgi:hypothetical protein